MFRPLQTIKERIFGLPQTVPAELNQLTAPPVPQLPREPRFLPAKKCPPELPKLLAADILALVEPIAREITPALPEKYLRQFADRAELLFNEISPSRSAPGSNGALFFFPYASFGQNERIKHPDHTILIYFQRDFGALRVLDMDYRHQSEKLRNEDGSFTTLCDWFQDLELQRQQDNQSFHRANRAAWERRQRKRGYKIAHHERTGINYDHSIESQLHGVQTLDDPSRVFTELSDPAVHQRNWWERFGQAFNFNQLGADYYTEWYKSTETFLDQASALLAKNHSERTLRLLAAVRAELHPMIRAELKQGTFPNLQHYNFAIRAASDEAVLRRFRWAESFPAFVSAMTHPKIEEIRDYAQLLAGKGESPLTKIIDQGGKFCAIAARHYNCDPALIKRLSREPIEKFESSCFTIGGTDDIHPIESFIRCFRAHPLERIPVPSTLWGKAGATEEAPNGFAYPVIKEINRLFDALGISYRNRLTYARTPLEKIISRVNGDWLGLKRGLDTIHKREQQPERHAADFVCTMARSILCAYFFRDDMSRGFSPVSAFKAEYDKVWHFSICKNEQEKTRDFYNAFEESLYSPRKRAELAMFNFLCSHWNVAQFYRASRKWHADIARIRDPKLLLQQPDDQSWPAWCEPQQTNDGYKIIPLLSKLDLRIEGQEMSHCVGGYDEKCRSGQNQVFSLRDRENRRLSTLLVKFDSDTQKPYANAQNLSFGNQQPSVEAVLLARWFIVSLNEGKIESRAPQILQKRREDFIKSLRLDPDTVCGFSAFNDEAWQAAASRFMRYLPKPYQNLDVQSLCKEILAQAHLEEVENFTYLGPDDHWKRVPVELPESEESDF